MSPDPTDREDFQSLEKDGTDFSKPWNRPPWLLALFVMLVAVVPYLFAIRHSFVYDDHGSIVENLFLQQPGAWLKTITLQTFFQPHILDGQRPVVILSYLIDQWLWSGFKPIGFHATNILLHALAVWILFALLSVPAFSASLRLRVCACLLYGLHPALTEAVQVPAFREDLLAAVFTLAFLRFATTARILPALLSMFLALCSKETAIVAPILLAWFWLCFPQHSQTAGRKPQIVLLAASTALVVLYLAVTFTHRPLQSAGQVWNGLALRWPENISTAPWLFALTLKTLLFPFPLCADYVIPPANFLSIRFVTGTLLSAVFLAAAFRLRRQAPVIAFGLGWLLINFAPVSNIIPLFNPLADRYLYLPAAGFALVIAGVITALIRDARIAAAVCAAICAVYFALAVRRLGDWRNDETLWRATAEAEPRSARAQTWLGIIASEKGDVTEMRQRYELASRLNPQAVHSTINLGVLDAQSGNLAAAEEKFRAATERRPDFPEGWWNLAVALQMQGREAEARQAANRAAAISSDDPRAAAFGINQRK